MSLPDPQIAEAAAARLLAGLNTRADEWAARIGLGHTVARLMLSPRRVARVVELIKAAYCEGANNFCSAMVDEAQQASAGPSDNARAV